MCHRLPAPLSRLTLYPGFLILALAISTGASANIIVQNDSIGAPGAGTPLPNFLANEQAAAWLTTPVSGDIIGVQFFWDSLFGTNPPQNELAIHIYGGGTFPTPGPLLATINFPTLNDRALNQFNFLDPPANTMPIKVPVTAGQTFVVSIEFLNQSSGFPSASAIEYDLDGCQTGRNSVFTVPGGWSDACLAGVTGDFGIRAIVQQIPEPGTVGWLVLVALICPLRCRSRS